ncbi:MAG: hypothetical protein ACREFF_10275 [Candidatus Udaeobacter sp.]
MSYSTSHEIHEYLKAASLAVCHEYKLLCQRRSEEAKRQILLETREIDLCMRIARYFGASAHLAAQGTNDIDIIVDGPTIRAEVKYFPSPARAWSEQVNRKDWDWLLATSNTNREFNKRVWIAFFPSTAFRKFTSCVSVTRGHNDRFSLLDFAPFAPFVEPELPPHGVNQRLRYKPVAQILRMSTIQLPGGKRVLARIVGDFTHPLWSVVYTRIAGLPVVAAPPTIAITDDPL